MCLLTYTRIPQFCISYLRLDHALYYVFFFFSSRRRHTRFKCDWSSDVCSSDLPSGYPRLPRGPPRQVTHGRDIRTAGADPGAPELLPPSPCTGNLPVDAPPGQIGRASCRERV